MENNVTAGWSARTGRAHSRARLRLQVPEL